MTGHKLIVYEVNLASNRSSLGGEDVQPFADFFSGIPKESQQKVDLLLHSPGGDIDAAEKIVYMCRQAASQFRVIVPEYAKSAATLIALASDEIIMGVTSELGPIDPQLTGPGPSGGLFQTSAQYFLTEFERVKEEVGRTGTLSPAYFPLLEGLNLGFLGMCRSLIERSRQFAEKWLKQYMLKGNPTKAKKVAKELSDAEKWLSHGRVIDADEAKNKLKINVRKLTQDDELWQYIWYLHCCYGVLFRKTGISKIYESETVSLPFQ